MSTNTYLLFHLVGYDVEDYDNPANLKGRVIIRLIDSNFESALERAKKLINKPYWLLAEAVEYFINQKES